VSDRIAELKERVVEAEAEAEHYRSLVQAFFSGDPMGRGIDHIIMAQWGRRRLAEKQENKSKVAALLKTE
jgi:hypothetical protein